MSQWLKICFVVLSLILTHSVAAHQLSTSYIIAEMDDTGRINGEWQLSLTDLELAVGLDLNANGELTWGEVKNRQAEIAGYLAEHLLLSRDNLLCNLSFNAVERLQDHANEAFAVTDFSGQCAISGPLTVKYKAIFALDSSHEMLLNIGDGNNMHSFVLDDNTQEVTLDLKEGSRWVELGIAISVLFAALNNIWPIVLRLAWLTFAFGLLHGMGFAGVLGELGLPADQQLLSILAFNLGVEIGQLAILAILLPVLILLRNTKLYSKGIMPVGSLLIAMMAVQWSIERW